MRDKIGDLNSFSGPLIADWAVGTSNLEARENIMDFRKRRVFVTHYTTGIKSFDMQSWSLATSMNGQEWNETLIVS
jgi:hypothetical protein